MAKKQNTPKDVETEEITTTQLAELEADSEVILDEAEVEEQTFEDPVTGEVIKGEAAIKAKAESIGKTILYGDTQDLPSQDIKFGDDGIVSYEANGNLKVWRIPERTFLKWSESERKSFLENQGIRLDNAVKIKGEVFQKVTEEGQTFYFVEERI